MRKEVSSGAVAFNISGDKTIRVLLLGVMERGKVNSAYSGEYLDMPKGHVERGESLERAAHREIMEEIGVPLHIDTNFKEEIRYTFQDVDRKTGKKTQISKRVNFFVAFLSNKEVKQIALTEHSRYYLLPIDEAIQKVKFQNQKNLLKKAKIYITDNYLT